MEDIEIEEGEACINHDNDEKIDPDTAFSYIDKRIQDLLGHYQKDFMGGVSAEILGARWGGYGSFLREASNSPLSHSRSLTEVNARSKPSHYTISEGLRQKAMSQANPPLPAKIEPATSACSVQSLPVPATCSPHGQARGNQQKHMESHPLSPTKVYLEVGSGKFVTTDMSELYSCLGLVLSPSPSPGDNPPPEHVQTSIGVGETLGKSPSVILKAMTSFPVPGDLLSPLPDNLLSLGRKESKNNEKDKAYPGHEASQKKYFDLISSKKRVGVTEEKKVTQRDENGQLTGLEKKSLADSVKSLDICLKKKEDGGLKGEETIHKCPPTENGVNKVSNDEAASNIMVKDSVSRSKPKTHLNGQEDSAVEQLVSLTSQRQMVVDKEKSNNSMEMLCKDKKVFSVMKKHNQGDEPGLMLGPKGTSKLSKQVKCSVKDSLPDALSSQEDGIHDQRKMNMKVKKVRKENMANPNGGKGHLVIQKHGGDKHDNIQRSKAHSSRAKSGSDWPNSKECSSADGKKKLIQKGKNHYQSNTVLPKVSFRVGSSSLLQGQNTNPGTGSLYSGKMDDLAPHKDVERLDKGYIDSAGINIPKDKKIITSMKGSALGAPKGEKRVSRKSNNKLPNKELHGASTVRSSKEEVPQGSMLLMENGRTSLGHAEVPPAPVVINENWVECEKCLKWRLLPLHLTLDDLADKWRCNMLTWLPGMNECRVSEDQTTEAVRATYQPIPPAIETKNGQKGPYIDDAFKIGSFDTDNVDTFNQAVGSFVGQTSGDKRQHQEVFADSKKHQRKAVEIESKKMNQPTSAPLNCLNRIGDCGTVRTGKKRPSLDEADAVNKKPKRRHKNSIGDMDSNNLLSTAFRKTGADCPSLSSHAFKDPASSSANAISYKVKENVQRPTNTGAQEMNVLLKKRYPKDLDNDERRQLKKLKLSEGYELQKKESERNQESGIDDLCRQEGAHRGSSSRKDGKRDGKSLVGKCERNSSNSEVDTRKLSAKLDTEARLPDPASTSSTSKISSKLKGKSDKVRCSPIVSIPSSPLKISRSNHDRNRNPALGCHNELEESLMMKKKAPKLDESDDVKRKDDKAKNAKEPDFLKSKPVNRGCGIDKRSSGKPVHDGTWENEVKLEVHENAHKETHHFRKDQQAFSWENLASKDQVLCAVDGLNEDTNNNESAGLKGMKSKRACLSGRAKEFPSSSSSQFVDCEAGVGSDTLPFHGSDVSFPNLVSEDLGPSSSGKKDGVDWAAATALKEAKRLKHSANRMKISGSGLSTMVFFEAALKFLHGASLMETGDSEGVRCGDMKPMEVYTTTAKLCQYCAREFEKSNDLASAALAYKCTETAYMRVLYCYTAVTGRDVQVLRTAERTIPQAASPSSSASDVDNVNNAPASEAASSSASRGNVVIPAGDQPSYLRTLKIIDYVHFAMDAARKSIGTYEVACLALEEAGKAEGVVSLRRAVDFSFNNIEQLLQLVRLAMEAVGGVG